MKKKIINVYIDGFNMYHAIKKFGRKYYWLDYKKLAEQFIDNEKEILGKVYYFTAYFSPDANGVERHKTYIKALNERSIITIKGKYQKVERNYTYNKKRVILDKCEVNDRKIKDFIRGKGGTNDTYRKTKVIKLIKKISYKTWEEKRTDVNMAIQIVSDGLLDKYDKAIIISGDSDISPAIVQVRKMKEKEFLVVLPIGKRGLTMKQTGDSHRIMTEECLQKSLLDNPIKGIYKPDTRE